MQIIALANNLTWYARHPEYSLQCYYPSLSLGVPIIIKDSQVSRSSCPELTLVSQRTPFIILSDIDKSIPTRHHSSEW